MRLQTEKESLESKIINLIKKYIWCSPQFLRQITAIVRNNSKNQTNDSAAYTENSSGPPEGEGKNIANLSSQFPQT